MAIAIFVCGTASAQSLKKMEKKVDKIEYSVDPEVLTVKGGEVAVEVTATIPAKYFNKKATVVASPSLQYGEETLYEGTEMEGQKVNGNAIVVSKKEGAVVKYTGAVTFEDAMRISSLYVKYDAQKKKKSRTYYSDEIAKGVIATETLVDKEAATAEGGNNFQRIVPQSCEAAIYYLINSADIRSSQSGSAEMKDMVAFAKDASDAEDMELKNIVIESYASPDGTQDWNQQVADNRDKASSDYIAKQMKKVAEAQDADFYEKYVVAEDWDGFQEAMEASDIEDKDLILNVLATYSDPDVRESEIKNISSAYEIVAEEILPKLRRSKFTVNADKIGKSDEEISALAESDPSELDIEELLYAATLVDDLDEKLAIYEKAMELYPDDWRAYNDYAIIKYYQGDYDAADEYFVKAADRTDGATIANNIGCMELYAGNVDEAERCFKVSDCEEAQYNLGIVSILKGEYADAVDYFGDATDFNACLAAVLAGDNAVAADKLEASEDEVDYLKAVVAARNNDTADALACLKSAVEKNADWKEVAATDMEFYALFGTSEFEEIVK